MIDFNNSVLSGLVYDKKPKTDKVASMLTAGENVIGSYSSARDSFVFTDRRIIAVNIQGFSGKKIDYTSIPYSKISVFSIETAGMTDLNASLELCIIGLGKVRFEFSGSSDITSISKCIAEYVLG